MKVLLVADEFFSWGVYGGFGAFTRKLGKELVKRGIETEAIVHQISNSQKPVGEIEIIDGVSVKTLPRKKPTKLLKKQLYKTDADIIHSQCGMYDTYLTFKRNESTKKIVTVQDLRTKKENKSLRHLEKTSGYPWYKKLWAMYVRSCYSKAMKTSDVVACQAKLLVPKVKEIYGVETDMILPNFIDVPNGSFNKSDTPTVVWLGRLDPIKCPERCFELARRSCDVEFYIFGASHDAYGGEKRDRYFMNKYRDVKNLHFLGFQSGKTKETVLRKSWILVNTSEYECLPVSFLEALAYKCTILSTQNPDNYTVRFGAWANPSSLKTKLDFLLEQERWRNLGEKGYSYVKQNHLTEKGVETHLNLYRRLLEK